MDWLQIEGREIPLLEAPQKYEDMPRRGLYVLFKRKRLIGLVFLAFSLPILLYLLSRPTQYTATAKVLIKPTREFLNISPTGGRESSLGILPSPEVLNTEIQIIKSPQLAERLAKDVPFPGQTGYERSEGEIRSAGRALKGMLIATPAKSANVIEISMVTQLPQQWAAQAVNRAAELYLEEHVKVHKTPGVEEFYDEQEKKLRLELAKAEDTLKTFQAKENIIDAPAEVTAHLTGLASFDRSLKETDSGIRETEQKIAVLEEQLKQQKATISSSTSIAPNPVYQQMRTRITQLELERDGLLQRYTADDRLVKDKEKEIDELKSKLQSVSPTAVGSESISLNDVHRRVLNELLASRVQLRALNEKKANLTRQVEGYSAAASEKKVKGFEYDRLVREVNTKKQNLDLYRQKAEEARISEAMDERKFSNAYILERAVPPLPKAGRSFISLLMIGLILAAGAAIGAAFALEYLDTTVRNESDIEELIGLPVLAAIQYHGDLRALPSK